MTRGKKKKWYGKPVISGAARRRKGHDLERYVSKTLRDIYPHARTSRRESKTMDDCGVDVVNVPFLIQCKSGYESPRPKYERLFEHILSKISELPNKEYYNNMPPVVIHKLNRHSKDDALTVMRYSDFINLLKQIKQ